jgi:hypothetical protein
LLKKEITNKSKKFQCKKVSNNFLNVTGSIKNLNFDKSGLVKSDGRLVGCCLASKNKNLDFFFGWFSYTEKATRSVGSGLGSKMNEQ